MTDRPTPGQTRDRATRMVRYLRHEVLPVPAKRAAVRAALGHHPGEPRTFGAYREVGAFLATNPRFGEDRAFLAVAAMICAQPASNRKQDISAGEPEEATDGSEDGADQPAHTSLGTACAEAVRRGRILPNTAESRLHLLCRVDAEDVHRQLPRLVHHLRGVGVAIDWSTLIVDLASWHSARQPIAARWMRDFYRGQNSPSKADENTPEDPS